MVLSIPLACFTDWIILLRVPTFTCVSFFVAFSFRAQYFLAISFFAQIKFNSSVFLKKNPNRSSSRFRFYSTTHILISDKRESLFFIPTISGTLSLAEGDLESWFWFIFKRYFLKALLRMLRLIQS